MDVRIGVTYSAREIDLQLPDDTDRAKLQAEITTTLENDDAVLWLTDRRGRTVGVPSARIAFVELGSGSDSPIGFST